MRGPTPKTPKACRKYVKNSKKHPRNNPKNLYIYIYINIYIYRFRGHRRETRTGELSTRPLDAPKRASENPLVEGTDMALLDQLMNMGKVALDNFEETHAAMKKFKKFCLTSTTSSAQGASSKSATESGGCLVDARHAHQEQGRPAPGAQRPKGSGGGNGKIVRRGGGGGGGGVCLAAVAS